MAKRRYVIVDCALMLFTPASFKKKLKCYLDERLTIRGSIWMYPSTFPWQSLAVQSKYSKVELPEISNPVQFCL